MNVLDKIAKDTERRVEEEKQKNPLDSDEFGRGGGRSLKESIDRESGISIIPEVKRSSPSQGEIREDFELGSIVKQMERGGAAGISVLTEPKYFDGSAELLSETKEMVDLPVLRKDFIVDDYQLYRTSRMNADAVLLITEILGEEISNFVAAAHELGLESMVEVHSEEQLELAKDSGADLIGVNNRNLKTMKIDLTRTERLLENLSEGQTSVSESGIKTRDDVARMRKAGADSVLVGTAVMKAEDVEDKVRDLLGGN